YGWKLHDPLTSVSLPMLGSTTITIRTMLIGVYALLLVICAIAAAAHHRRNDPRLPMALLTPWVLMFAILPQMHERYLVWAAAIGGIGLAVSPAAALLHLPLIAISSIMHAHQILSRDRNFAPELLRLAEWTHPGIGFTVVLLAMVYVFLACTPSPGRSRSAASGLWNCEPGGVSAAGSGNACCRCIGAAPTDRRESEAESRRCDPARHPVPEPNR
ncbi:MAG TPA: hypothetical protein VNL70_05020, partial [Tepidisphaeraceae bacterium]|nr:hypothetical protein [Tepidisphaeraceae bacterium]